MFQNVYLFLHSFFLHFDWLVPFLTQQVVINTQIVVMIVQQQNSVSTRKCQQQFSRIYFDFRLSFIIVCLFVYLFVSLFTAFFTDIHFLCDEMVVFGVLLVIPSFTVEQLLFVLQIKEFLYEYEFQSDLNFV
jgi:hypothetical protein